jgi:hypothetical protein
MRSNYLRLSVPLFSLLAAGGVALAQAGSPGASAPGGALPNVPTTKVLAIGHIVAANAGSRAAIMPSEVRETVKLYLGGKIDQWYVRRDQPGVVFLMNVSTVEEAHRLLEALPLGKAGVMAFDLVPLGPLSPLNYLLVEPAAKP